MKQQILAQCVLATLALTSATVNAEDKYPASDFKPTVVYQDDSVSKSSDSDSSKPSSSASASSSNSEYPAANFQPKVVYEDESYKHADIPVKSSSKSTSNDVGSYSSSSVAAQPETAKKDDSSMGYLLGLVALLGAGFYLFKKGKLGVASSSSSRDSSANYAANAGGPTGVSRYLLKISGTGVSRYIEKNVKAASSSSATGVAKYLANQSKNAPATTAATGVEKYLKNKG